MLFFISDLEAMVSFKQEALVDENSCLASNCAERCKAVVQACILVGLQRTVGKIWPHEG